MSCLPSNLPANLTAILAAAALLLMPSALSADDPDRGASDEESKARQVRSEWSGHVELEGRGFRQSPGFDGQETGAHFSIALEPEYFREWSGGRERPTDRLIVRPFLRLDSADDERSHGDLRELYWQRILPRFELDIGLRRVFWGVTESLHLVDIVNQTDGVEDIDGEDKLGQPMIRLGLSRPWGLLEIFLLPGFRERTFAGREGRLRPAFEIDADGARYQSSAGREHVDLALRWSRALGDVDLGLSYFRGTSREPAFLLGPSSVVDTSKAVPYYAQIDQVGIDLQATLGAWLWKLEALGRSFDAPVDPSAFPQANLLAPALVDHAAAVGGFEYTFFDLRGSGLDVGLLAEYLWDERGDGAPTPFEDDLFVASRLAWNDVQGTELLAGATFDLDSSAYFLSMEGNRRLGERFELEVRLRLFGGTDQASNDPIAALARDDYLQVSVRRYF